MQEDGKPAGTDMLVGIGPSIEMQVARCEHGGFVVIVEGNVHSAWTEGWQAVEALSGVLGAHFGQTFSRPSMLPELPPTRRDLREEPLPEGGPRFVQPPRMVPREAAVEELGQEIAQRAEGLSQLFRP
jgi:hypothetical protein